MQRVHTRDEGLQIALSPPTPLVASTGAVNNDAAEVLEPAVTLAAGASTPFKGTAVTVPGLVAASDFDNGGEGVAYHDATAGNRGGAYRQTDVDLEVSTDGGNNVGWIAVGEWLNYSVNVASAGAYSVTFRVAASGQGGTFHLEMNGANVTGPLAIPDTGGWQVWQSVSRTVTLAAGAQTARLVIETKSAAGVVGNINSIRFARLAAPQSTPYSGTAVSLPGRVQAENFDNGGEGVAYHDTTSGNSGGAFRATDVDLQPASAGGYNVGWAVAGEWLNYSVTVATAGAYTLNVRVAASRAGGTFHVEMNGANVSGSLTIPVTGGWQNWQTVSKAVTLNAGPQVARLVMDTNGAAAVGNLDWFEFIGPATTPTPSGVIIRVPSGGNLQLAIDAAQPGDTILLAPGAVYRGSFVLPVKSGGTYITIRSGAPDAVLPADGVRVGPQDVPNLARIEGGFGAGPAFRTTAGAHHYRLLFLEMVNTFAAAEIIQLGDGGPDQNTLASVPHDLFIDHCYIHGDATNGQKRGVALNSAATTISNSYIANIKSSQQDSQAIGGWNGPGPYLIVNNYLEASGENVMFGGADPFIPGLVPSDITLRQNYISKPVAWRGQQWIVKNLLELKNAQRVTIDGNLIENIWPAAQSGFAIVFTPRNQDGASPWSVVQQVQFTNNVVRHVSAVFNVLGNDNIFPSQMTNGITIRNNLFVDVSAATWGGSGWFLITNGGRNITVDHNTVFTDGAAVVLGDGAQVTGFTFTNNIVPDNAWAITGSGTAPGNAAIASYYPAAVIRRNVFTAGHSGTYPTDNYFPPNVGAVQFVDLVNGNFRLGPTSPYRSLATDGANIGFDQSAVEALVPVR
jgi:hypothetical protein